MARKSTTPREPQAISCATETAEFSPNPRAADRVRHRAYELYLERCRNAESGDALSDWVTAEQELTEAGDQDREDVAVNAELGGSGI